MKLDELPSELIFTISRYLTLFDIGYSLIGVCNRLDKLLAENQNDRRTLAFHDGHCSYSLYEAFLTDHNGFRSRCLNTFIRSLILDGFCNILCTYTILSRCRAGQLSSKNELTQFNSLQENVNSIQFNFVESAKILQLNSTQLLDDKIFPLIQFNSIRRPLLIVPTQFNSIHRF